MKITNVQAFLMSSPMPEPLRLPFWGGERTILKRDAMLIVISTDSGLKGFAPGPAHERAAYEINHSIRDFLLDKNPLQWESYDFQTDPETLKIYRTVEIALLDLTGKWERCTVSELLGGRQRHRIKLYGSAGMYMPPEKYAEEAAAVAELGFPAYKMRPGLGPADDLRTVELMRKAAPELGLMVDAHTWWRMGDKSYSFEMTQQLIVDMAAYSPVWVEEPMPPDNHDAYRLLKQQMSFPLASGEHEPSEERFWDLIDTSAVDMVQMDILCQGGYKTAQKLFERVEKKGLKFAFHSWGTALEVMAAAQIGICWPEQVVEWLEYPCYSHSGRPGMYPFPISDDILSDPLDIQNGYLIVQDEPGLGVQINESIIEKWPFIPGPWSYFHLDSPPETIAVTGDHSVKWVKGEEND